MSSSVEKGVSTVNKDLDDRTSLEKRTRVKKGKGGVRKYRG